MSETQKLGPLQTEWIRRLRSGKYVQGTGYLKWLNGRTKATEYCCLGIACEVAMDNGVALEVTRIGNLATTYDGEHTASLPSRVSQLLKFRGMYGPRADDNGDLQLSGLNDSGKTFSQIADIVSKDPVQYFTEPA